jgi:lipopolysaccharide transport system ATP-binding protein
VSAAIHVESVSKRFQIGARENAYTTFREALSGIVTSPFRRFKSLSGRVGAHEFFWALKDVSFDVEPGEVVGIIGRNGAGKSTLLKILSQITEPTQGRVKIHGRVASLLEVGTGFHPELTGRENIFLNGSILGMSRSEVRRKFDEIVEFSGVEKFIDTPVKRFSSGMTVRLAFSVAAHLEPEILIVDEVLAVGDAEFQKKCLGKMESYSHAGRTILFVSHNIAAVENLCSRAVLLAGGRVRTIGSCSEVIDEYLQSATEQSWNGLENGRPRLIRAVYLTGRDGQRRDTFFVGEDVVFEIEFYAHEAVEDPRCGIAIYSPRGDRLATLGSDVQQNLKWDFQGTKRIRIIWRNVPLNVGNYRIDVSFVAQRHEFETVKECRTLHIHHGDVYGTGKLPNPSFQGFLIPDAEWEFDIPMLAATLTRRDCK